MNVDESVDRSNVREPGSSDLDGASRDRRYLQTLANGLRVLRLIGAGERTIAQVATELSTDRSNAYRIMRTLEAGAFVRRLGASGPYRLHPSIWDLGVNALGVGDLLAIAGQHVRSLADITAETVHLAVYDDGEVVYVDKADGNSPIRSYTKLGGRAPAFCVATGKVLLAYAGEDEIERIISRGLTRYTTNTITDPDALRAELMKVREAEMSVNRAEWRDGVGGVAVPIRDHAARVIAALGHSGPLDRILARMSNLTPGLRSAADEISLELGARSTIGNHSSERRVRR